MRSVLQPSQAGLEGGDHGLAAVAGDQDAGLWRRALRELGGENEVVAPALQELPEQLLGLAELIGVGRVDEVAAGLGIGIEDAARLVGVGAVPPSRAEHPGSQHELGYAQAGVPAEDLVAHSEPPGCRPAPIGASPRYMTVIIILDDRCRTSYKESSVFLGPGRER